MIINVSDREFHTILAALRHWQSEINEDIDYKGLLDISSNGGEVRALDVDEVDDLCERINTTDTSDLQLEIDRLNEVIEGLLI